MKEPILNNFFRKNELAFSRKLIAPSVDLIPLIYGFYIGFNHLSPALSNVVVLC